MDNEELRATMWGFNYNFIAAFCLVEAKTMNGGHFGETSPYKQQVFLVGHSGHLFLSSDTNTITADL